MLKTKTLSSRFFYIKSVLIFVNPRVIQFLLIFTTQNQNTAKFNFFTFIVISIKIYTLNKYLNNR